DGVAWYEALAIAAVTRAGGAEGLRLHASRAGGRLSLGAATVPLDLRGALPLNFYGPAGTIRTLSVADLPETGLEDAIVFVGATATGFGDRHATPFDAAFPGVELHATLAANLIGGHVLRRDAVAWGWDILLALLAAGAGFAAAGSDRPWIGAVAGVAVVAATAAVLQ
ncbi:CHASE2 domain-containing protein, partial [Cribrihabitans sp. XS_ASV171]